MITKQVIQLIQIILVGTDVCFCIGVIRSTRRKPTCPTWWPHADTGIKPRLQLWEAIALLLRQFDSHLVIDTENAKQTHYHLL